MTGVASTYVVYGREMLLGCLPRQPHGDVLATVRRYAVFDKRMDVFVWHGKQFEADGNDLLREMVRCFADGALRLTRCAAPTAAQSAADQSLCCLLSRDLLTGDW